MNPLALFNELRQKAEQTETYPTAMNLATVDPQTLMPRSRVVLLNRVTDKNELEFFSNYLSAKAKDLEANPKACVNFFWPEMYYQIVIQGTVTKTSAQISDEYFANRVKEKQVASLTSTQSQVVESYHAFVEAYHANMKAFEGQTVPRPNHWGGYHLTPQRVEIWRGSEVRLHERQQFILNSNGEWEMQVLAP